MTSPRTQQALARLADLTPRQIVAELDRYIVGQADAKKAVAIALRNRWRRQRAPECDPRRDLAEQHHPHRSDRRRQDGDRAPAREARRRAVHQGRGVEVHRGRLRRPRRGGDGARPRRERDRHGAQRARERGRGPRATRSVDERLLDLLLPPPADGKPSQPRRQPSRPRADVVRRRRARRLRRLAERRREAGDATSMRRRSATSARATS